MTDFTAHPRPRWDVPSVRISGSVLTVFIVVLIITPSLFVPVEIPIGSHGIRFGLNIAATSWAKGFHTPPDGVRHDRIWQPERRHRPVTRTTLAFGKWYYEVGVW